MRTFIYSSNLFWETSSCPSFALVLFFLSFFGPSLVFDMCVCGCLRKVVKEAGYPHTTIWRPGLLGRGEKARGVEKMARLLVTPVRWIQWGPITVRPISLFTTPSRYTVKFKYAQFTSTVRGPLIVRSYAVGSRLHHGETRAVCHMNA